MVQNLQRSILRGRLGGRIGIATYRTPKVAERGFYRHSDSTINVNLCRQRRVPRHDVHHNGYYLCVLLHEMLHAFFYIYSCKCTNCRSQKPALHGGVGASGHGPAWVDAAYALQMAFQELVSWEVFLGIPKSVQLETRVSGWKPDLEQRRRWGIPNSSYAELISVESKRHRQVSCLPIL
jgi:hypothetical protein